MSNAQEFEACIADWESYDEWQFADRKAERQFFYLAGRNAGLEKGAEICELEADFLRNDTGWGVAETCSSLIRKEMEE